MKTWNPNWKRSTKARKQRKYAARAPLHARSTLLGSHLSKELRQKHKKRSLRVRAGDKIVILVGEFKGKSGKVERVETRFAKVYVTGIERVKKDGSKALAPVHPSNLVITELHPDKKRIEATK